MMLYWVFALSTELLAIPPDFATPVWPSAGIALGFVVVYGWQVVPGVFLGALAANISVSMNQGIAIDLEKIAFAGSISIGAVVQAVFARFLLIRLRLLPEALTGGAQIIQFLVVIGPLSCLVNSLNGSLMLGLFDIVPWSGWFRNWVVWWVGDAVGALVVTPFVLRILSPAPTAGERWVHSSVLPLVFLALVVSSFFFVRGLEQNNRRTLIADLGQQFEAVLKLNINEVRVLLGAANSFFTASDYVSGEAFDTFFQPLLEEHPAVLAVEWLPLVKAEDRKAFVNEMRRQGITDFEIREPGVNGNFVVSRDRQQYLPIKYIYPMNGNEQAHGLDVLSLSYRSDPALALDTGLPQASGPITLVQHAKSELSYILTAPVKHPRTKDYVGVVQVLIRVGDLLNRAAIGGGVLESLRMVDMTNPQLPVYLHGKEHQAAASEWSSSIHFLGRDVRLDLISTYGMMVRVSSWQSYAILIVGLLYVAMLEAVLLTMLTRQVHVESLVELKTRELAQAKDVAEKASMAKTEFLASMSHELRTPLNSVIGFTRRVLQRSSKNLDERSRDALVVVERNANHLLGLINNLLDISKVDLGKLELSVSELALDALLMEARDQFAPLAQAKNTSLILDCHFHGVIEADPTRVRQIVINLLSNAIKFTVGGKVTVRLVEHSAKDTAGVLLEVLDTGIGILPEDIEKLFNKFQKVGKVDRLNPEGTGLGLALVKELVEIHGGTVTVSSEPGKLTIFSVWLPQRQH